MKNKILKEKRAVLYTCKAGLQLKDAGDDFFVWTKDSQTYKEHHTRVMVSCEYLEQVTDGVYSVAKVNDLEVVGSDSE